MKSQIRYCRILLQAASVLVKNPREKKHIRMEMLNFVEEESYLKPVEKSCLQKKQTYSYQFLMFQLPLNFNKNVLLSRKADRIEKSKIPCSIFFLILFPLTLYIFQGDNLASRNA